MTAAALALSLAACAPESGPTVDLPAQVDAAFADDTQAQLQAAVDRAVAASGASGAVVGVWAPWAGTWLAGAGTVAPGAAGVDDGASFTAGSITRAMTCDVLYGMVADGVVKLEDSVATYVPGVPALEGITLAQLCNSTSGLAPYLPAVFGRIIATPDRVWNERELVGYGITRAGTAPGSFADSDTGYVLLGIALERASRVSIEALYEKYVFDPIGMPDTSLPASAAASMHGLWSPNNAEGAVECAAPIDLSDLSPTVEHTAGGVVSDLEDLGRYTQALALGVRSYDKGGRFDAPLPAAGDAASWFTATGGTYQAGTLVGQYGSIPGFLTAAFADRNTGMTVVVALNNSRASDVLVRALAWELAAITSKAPAATGQTAPDAGLPWTADDMAAQVTAAAVCPIP
ncbi:serine hydrolase [Microbacterium sp.]|uniref:serine hydrolase domain-containing protein n=1 Tax=Microbacterium sp. TaxID=51671 RepID=UPI0025F36F5C|nr:serine hydrolase domain-containing protein [Microbacterium sp.]